ncbi:hypothetical protein EDB81DRAFT_784321 [Dactylonectria macrodidyma]|uniref:Uncharacterized protein n=1 Tax=Dactylonectria macrodidyma TaxID=307937 RepID=A0A9P9FGB8_9HYPO|nr:hypothetical protein EDB81DRAFT_784321 [Dactylonectria macrodidyma]
MSLYGFTLLAWRLTITVGIGRKEGNRRGIVGGIHSLHRHAWIQPETALSNVFSMYGTILSGWEIWRLGTKLARQHLHGVYLAFSLERELATRRTIR